MSVAKDKQTGKWFYRIRVYDEHGNLVKQSKKRGFDTKKEALEAERNILSVPVKEDPSDRLFAEVITHYLDHYTTRNKRRSSYCTANIAKLHIIPFFANKKANEITPKSILDWQNNLKKLGYSTNYIQKIHTNLSSIFIHGIKYFDITKNPCQVVGNIRHKEKKEMLFWTIQEFKQFLKVVDNQQDYVLFNALFWTGMRKGELLALKWNDIDLQSGIIHVNKTLSNDGRNGWELTSPKTRTSQRDILMISELKKLFLGLYQRNRHLVAFNKTYFVFGSDKPMSFTTLDRIYSKYTKISSVKRIRIHDFRHSFASALIELGVDIMLLAQMLGHSSKEQIFETYGHLYPNKQQEAIDKLEKCAQTVPTPKLSIKKAHRCGHSGNMVEMRGVEPLSEKTSIQASTSIDCVQN